MASHDDDAMDTSSDPLPKFPTVQQMENWKKDLLLQWLTKYYDVLEDQPDFENFRAAKIDGMAFLTKAGDDEWFSRTCNLPGGPSVVLAELARRIKQRSASQCTFEQAFPDDTWLPHIRWVGNLWPGDRCLKYPPLDRYGYIHETNSKLRFSDIYNKAICDKQPFIVHGPYQSGKSTIMLEMESLAKKQKIEVIPVVVEFAVSRGTSESWYDHVSHRVFNESLTRESLLGALSKRYRPDDGENARALFLFDEMQAMFMNESLKDEIRAFLLQLITMGIPYIGFGTFVLRELKTCEVQNYGLHTSLRDVHTTNSDTRNSPFNKTSFVSLFHLEKAMMSALFENYGQLCRQPVPDAIRSEIEGQSMGHASTFMGLLDTYHRARPISVLDWAKLVDRRSITLLNGLGLKIKDKIKQPAILPMVRELIGCGLEHIPADLDDLGEAQRTLLDVGVLSVIDDGSQSRGQGAVRFTNNLVLRRCVEIIKPRRDDRALSNMPEGNNGPVQFLEEGLRLVSPEQLTLRCTYKKDGPSEHIFHAELYASFRDLAPEGWHCASEARLCQGDSSTRVDLLMYAEESRSWGYELKAGKASESAIQEDIAQALAYSASYGVDFYVVNFLSQISAKPKLRILNVRNSDRKVYLVNVVYDNEMKSFEGFYLTQPSTVQTFAVHVVT